MTAGTEIDRDPRSVPGFDRATELGLTPQTPAAAPDPVTINSRFLLLGILAVSFAGLVVVLTVVNRLELPGWAYGVIAACLAGLVVGLLVWHRRVMWREIQAGYCRMDTMVALFSRDPEQRFPASRMKGAPWDLRGLWRLGDHGEVLRAPVPGVLAAGHYPSPNRPGELELWTGVAWAYCYEKPARTFL
ncbi:hypothetical protein ASG90_00880 [Nocardioides sp. Soil797]|nr:hypothetical protein ASG90_00880 [Nocardioides sp. Soil797]